MRFRQDPPPPVEISFIDRKATNAMRAHLLSLLRVPQFYDLDRLDLQAPRLARRGDAAPRHRQAAHAHRQCRGGAAGAGRRAAAGPRSTRRGVAYSVTLYEREAGLNYLRVQADNLDRPLDLNEGGKFDLGSTAKLRTLVTYLEIIADLHDRYADLAAAESAAAGGRGARSADHVGGEISGRRARTGSLQPMLDAAMQRKYSANTGEAFFTGRGMHVFANFDKTHNGPIMPVAEAFRYSVNLVFIRMMRDIVRYYQAERPEPVKAILADASIRPAREYLERFADMEGRTFPRPFYKRYRDRTPDQALAMLAAPHATRRRIGSRPSSGRSAPTPTSPISGPS